MITISQACSIAMAFYETKLHVQGLAAVKETDQFYIFSGGSPKKVAVGGAMLCVDKNDGQASVLRFPSKESTEMIRTAIPVELPTQFLAE